MQNWVTKKKTRKNISNIGERWVMGIKKMQINISSRKESHNMPEWNFNLSMTNWLSQKFVTSPPLLSSHMKKISLIPTHNSLSQRNYKFLCSKMLICQSEIPITPLESSQVNRFSTRLRKILAGCFLKRSIKNWRIIWLFNVLKKKKKWSSQFAKFWKKGNKSDFYWQLTNIIDETHNKKIHNLSKQFFFYPPGCATDHYYLLIADPQYPSLPTY